MAVLSAPIHHLDSCTPIRTDPGSTSLLKKQASSILESNQTYSVTNSPTPSPQGPNGFLSYGPYFWPNERELADFKREYGRFDPKDYDSIKWDRKDGKHNPMNTEGVSQQDELKEMAQAVHILALASKALSQRDPQFASSCAARAEKLLSVFFYDRETAMIPECECVQIVHGSQSDHRGRGPGIISLLNLILVSQSVLLLPEYSDRRNPYIPFLQRHVAWLLNSTIGKEALQGSNNIADWAMVQLATHLQVLRALAPDRNLPGILDTIQPHLRNLPISSNGAEKHELERTKPFHYTCFALDAQAMLCAIAEREGWRNVWAESGVQKAFDYALGMYERKEGGKGEDVDGRKLIWCGKTILNGGRVSGQRMEQFAKRISGVMGKRGETDELLSDWNVKARSYWECDA